MMKSISFHISEDLINANDLDTNIWFLYQGNPCVVVSRLLTERLLVYYIKFVCKEGQFMTIWDLASAAEMGDVTLLDNITIINDNQ